MERAGERRGREGFYTALDASPYIEAAARTLALGVDYNQVFDQDEEDLLIHYKVLRKAEAIVAERREVELKVLMAGAEQRVVNQMFN